MTCSSCSWLSTAMASPHTVWQVRSVFLKPVFSAMFSPDMVHYALTMVSSIYWCLGLDKRLLRKSEESMHQRWSGRLDGKLSFTRSLLCGSQQTLNNWYSVPHITIQNWRSAAFVWVLFASFGKLERLHDQNESASRLLAILHNVYNVPICMNYGYLLY